MSDLTQYLPTPEQRQETEKKRANDRRPKGLLGRGWGVITGAGGAIQAPFGLVKDIVTSPWSDDEYDGIIGSLFGYTKSRGGQVLGNLFGPDEGYGAAVNIIPAEARQRAARGVEGAALGALGGAGVGVAFGGVGALPGAIVGAIGGGTYGAATGRSTVEDVETVGREAIREPLSTAFTAGSLASAPGGGGVGGLLDPDTWQEAHRIAQDRSVGQSFALMFLTDDITNDNELAQAVGSAPYQVISTTTDAAARIVLEPDVLAGSLGRGGRLLIRNADDINRIARHPQFSKFVDQILDNPESSVLRDRFFSRTANGAGIADALAYAARPTEGVADGIAGSLVDPSRIRVTTTARALMGDRAAKDALLIDAPALGARVERLTAERSQLLEFADDSMFAQPERLAKVRAEIDELYPEATRLARLDILADQAPLREVPRPGQGQVRSAIKRSDFYQESPWATPLRATFEMIPNRWVNLHDPSGDIQLHRNLEASNLPQETRDVYRARYNNTSNPMERQRILVQAETEAVSKMAAEAGMTAEEVTEAMRQASSGRRQAQTVLKSRAYDGKNRSKVPWVDDDGVWHEINLPLFITQEANFHTLVDLNEVRRTLTKVGKFRARHPSANIPPELLGSFYRIWKPSVLLRAGWPIRVVGDEQMRMMAKIGTLATLDNTFRQGVPALSDRSVSATARAGAKVARQPAGRFAKEAVDERALGRFKPFTVRDYEMQAAFGTPGDAAELFYRHNSSAPVFDELLGVNETGILARLRERTGSYGGSITQDMPEYGKAWEQAVNLQFGQDVIGRKILDGQSDADIIAWLRSTPEGQQAALRFHFRAKEDPTKWVETMREVIDDYTRGDPVLRRLARDGIAKAKNLTDRIPDAADRPVVHGELLAQLRGEGVYKTWADGVLGGFYKALGSVPTDTLSRHPFFDHMYQVEAKRLVNVFADQGPITPAVLARIEDGARRYALNESKDLLYDLAEHSRLAEMLGFMMPFYSAWQEVLTRWSGLAVENPRFVARMRQVWQAPERAGIAIDGRGWELNEDGQAKDPISGRWVAAEGDTQIRFPIPEWARRNIPGLAVIGEMAFSKKSANMILQAPGFGPPVAVAVNEIAKGRPDLEGSLKWFLPFGIQDDWKQMMLPTTARRAYTRAQGDEDVQYANSRMRAYITMLTDYKTGKRATEPTFEEATKENDAFWSLRTIVSWTAPVAFQFNSPYQAHYEAFRAAQARTRDDKYALGRNEDGTPVTANEWFYDTYGEELYALTTSMSKTNEGIPPTMEGYEARKEHKGLIESLKTPSLAGLVVGAEGAGEYSNFVYQNQRASTINPQSKTKQRETPDFAEQSVQSEVSLGWLKYGRYMDLIEAERVQRGLPNLNVKDAEDLALIRREIIAKLEEKYPAWEADRGSVDLNAWEDRLHDLRRIAADERLAGRDEIEGLGDYLRYRDLMVRELQLRKEEGGSATLNATSNLDLADTWDSITGALVERNLAFGDLFYRWLDSDRLEVG